MMTVNERYADISKRTGISESIIRRIIAATRDSLAMSVQNGERATLPGICTFTSDIRDTMVTDINTGEVKSTKYLKLKAKPTDSFESIINTDDNINRMVEIEEKSFRDASMSGLSHLESRNRANVVRTRQIGALI